MSFSKVAEFEDKVASWFGAPFGIAVDCCTHGIELCIRYVNPSYIVVPKRTYISIPFLANKLGIELRWKDEEWSDYYSIGDTNIIDAAVLWREGGYIPGTLMCLSFQFQKHLNLGRGGMILTDNQEVANKLKRMSYDGRIPDVPWREQDIRTFGYHYYMSPEIASIGLDKLPKAINDIPRKWVISDWPDLTTMSVFNNKLSGEGI